MASLERHATPVAIVAAALLALAGFFVFLRPAYRPVRTTATVAMARQHHLGPAAVRAAFAAQGIHLRLANDLDGTRFYADQPAGAKDDAFLVTIYAPRAKVMFGTAGPKQLFSTRVGNVSVDYGGANARFAKRVAAAAAALERG